MFLLIAIRLLVKVVGWIFYAQGARIDPDGHPAHLSRSFITIKGHILYIGKKCKDLLPNSFLFLK